MVRYTTVNYIQHTHIAGKTECRKASYRNPGDIFINIIYNVYWNKLLIF